MTMPVDDMGLITNQDFSEGIHCFSFSLKLMLAEFEANKTELIFSKDQICKI